MPDTDRLLGMYLHLARASRMRQQPMVRAKLLVLAGVQAHEMGLSEISALCRHKVLGLNSRHLVRRWPTLGAALAAEPFQDYFARLKRHYSREKVEHMIDSLGIEMGQERAAYFSDTEYAASLLDTRPEAIAGVLAEAPRSERVRQNPARQSPARKSPLPKSDSGGTAGVRPVSDARKVLIVWAPFAAGLLVLALLAVFAGFAR